MNHYTYNTFNPSFNSFLNYFFSTLIYDKKNIRLISYKDRKK